MQGVPLADELYNARLTRIWALPLWHRLPMEHMLILGCRIWRERVMGAVRTW